jgi:hypothetical protein
MIDAFDAGFDQPAQPAREYETAPPGEYRAEIIKAERRRLPWKVSDTNPHGDCVSLRLRVGHAFGFVFVDVPDDLRWLARAVAQAVGLDGDELDPERLVGREARVLLKHYTRRDGSRKAAVGRWLPAPAADRAADIEATATLADAIHEWATRPPQTAQRPQRPASKPSRNAVKRHTADDDDIPF